MAKIYFISGLGADERVFRYLNIVGFETKNIKWEDPLKNESLTDYSKRLINQIDLNDKVILIGVSFGGMIAQEIADLIDCEKIIIISSIKSLKELDAKMRLVKQSTIYKYIPSGFLKWTNSLSADYYFSTKTKEESDLLNQIIKDTDRFFMKWAIEKIMNWKFETTNSKENLTHIHGTHDRIFPINNIKNSINIKEGGHFMIVNRAEEISLIIQEKLRE